MSEQVELRVKSGIKAVLEELESIRAKVEEVDQTFQQMGDQTAQQIKKKTKDTETFLSNLQGFGRRVADQLKRDFKALASVESLTAGLKLSEQFKGSISESITLSNTIRKLGATFGIAGKDFASFQQGMTQGLGEIGLSSETAARALEGLSQTPVRGATGLMEYSKTAGQLASVGREPGREGDIARSMAKVIMARGKDPNNVKQELPELAESVRRVTIQTGVQPTQILSNMEALFAQMPKDLRKTITSAGLANLSAAQAVAGPNSTKFLEEVLGKSPIARMAFEAQGGKDVFTDEGIDIEKFRRFSQSIIGRIGQDPRMAAQTLGLSEDAAEGFIRLSESLDRVSEAQDRIKKSTGNLNQSYRESMGLGEAFRANINRVKGNLSGFLEPVLQGGTEALSKAADSDVASGAVVAGGGLLAALLTGGGLRGVGKAALGTVGKGALAEKITGKETQPVYVVNAAEIGLGAGALPGTAAGGGAMGTAAKVVGAAGLALGVGVAAREGVNWVQEKTGPIGPSAQEAVDYVQETGGETAGAVMENLTNALIKLNNLLGANYDLTKRKEPAAAPRHAEAVQPPARSEVKVKVELNTRQLKATTGPSRGGSN